MKPTTTTTTLPITTDEVKLGGWWALPAEQQEAILAALPKLDQWSFTATRVSNAAWSIDVPEAGTYGELLVGGTNVALDQHFYEINGEDAVDGDEVTLTVSIKPMAQQTTTFVKTEDDKLWPGSATYKEQTLNLLCWLCPFTTIFRGHIPVTIHIDVE